MHVSKDSMWRKIWKFLQDFLGTKQPLKKSLLQVVDDHDPPVSQCQTGVTRTHDRCVMCVCPYTHVASSQPNWAGEFIRRAPSHRQQLARKPVRADGGWWTMLSEKKEQGGRHLGRTVRETFTCEGLLLLLLVLCRPPGDNERKRLVPADGGEAEAEVKDRAEQGVPPVSFGQRACAAVEIKAVFRS
jgi:hypothetical protein